MAIPIINNWQSYFEHRNEGKGSSYERVILNDILMEIVQRYGVRTALESPSFGFTGLSGINLMYLAKEGVRVSLEDHDETRLMMIQDLWQEAGLPLQSAFNPDYKRLDYPDAAFDLGFCFSALWFCEDLASYLQELARVSRRCIFISVPNRMGLGYKSQLKDYTPEKYPFLRPAHIDPASVISILKREGWQLVQSSLFDCPPWPDIGMSKEDFLHQKLGIRLPQKASTEAATPPLCIMDYYLDKDPGFAMRMRRLSFVEKNAPEAFKRIWAHHYYMLFTPQS